MQSFHGHALINSEDAGSKHCNCGAGDDDKELAEPLLGYAANSTTSSESHTQSRREQGESWDEGSRAVVPHSINRVDWEELWHVLWGSCHDSLAEILGEGLKHERNCLLFPTLMLCIRNMCRYLLSCNNCLHDTEPQYWC